MRLIGSAFLAGVVAWTPAALAGCPCSNQNTVTLPSFIATDMTFSNVDVYVPAGGMELGADVWIKVTNGCIIVDGDITGRPPTNPSRPDGDPGHIGYSLTLETVCISSTGIGGGGTSACCNVLINHPINLSGEFGADGEYPAKGNGGAGGAGGNGGALTVYAAGDIEVNAPVNTKGGSGGHGGDAGIDGMGGQGGLAGIGGDIILSHASRGAPGSATVWVYQPMDANGGDGGIGGDVIAQTCGGCGAQAETGGNGRNGGNAGNVTIDAKRAFLAIPFESHTIGATGGIGGDAGAGGEACVAAVPLTDPGVVRAIRALGVAESPDLMGLIPTFLLNTECEECAVHGGNAGDPGEGGNAGTISISASSASTGALDGAASILLWGGRAGDGAPGGGGGYIPPNCCGDFGANQPGGVGGSGGAVFITTSTAGLNATLDLNVVLNAQGGDGGRGGDGSTVHCDECGGSPGAHGGSGGVGGSLTYTGIVDASSPPSLLLNVLGGNGGDGGDSKPDAEPSPGGAAGPNGSVTINTIPSINWVFFGMKSNGNPGDAPDCNP